VSAYVRVNVGSVEALMSVFSSRASELGATTRDQRVALYNQAALTSAVLSSLETGSRVPTETEREAIYTAGDALGWGIADALLSALPASG